MRVLVCGGRTFNNPRLLWGTLDRLHEQRQFTTLIHGASRGADRLAGEWAKHNLIDVEEYPAAWHAGKRAGPIRNIKMLSVGKPRLVVAFRGGNGTMHMASIAERAGVETLLIGWDAQTMLMAAKLAR